MCVGTVPAVGTQCRTRQAWFLATWSLHFHSFSFVLDTMRRQAAKVKRQTKSQFLPRGTCDKITRSWPHVIRLPSSVGLPRSRWYQQPPSASRAQAHETRRHRDALGLDARQQSDCPASVSGKRSTQASSNAISQGHLAPFTL